MNIINILQKKYKEKGATLEKLCCFKKNAGFDKKSINQMIDFAAYENNIDRTGKNIFGVPIAETKSTEPKGFKPIEEVKEVIERVNNVDILRNMVPNVGDFKHWYEAKYSVTLDKAYVETKGIDPKDIDDFKSKIDPKDIDDFKSKVKGKPSFMKENNFIKIYGMNSDGVQYVLNWFEKTINLDHGVKKNHYDSIITHEHIDHNDKYDAKELSEKNPRYKWIKYSHRLKHRLGEEGTDKWPFGLILHDKLLYITDTSNMEDINFKNKDYKDIRIAILETNHDERLPVLAHSEQALSHHSIQKTIEFVKKHLPKKTSILCVHRSNDNFTKKSEELLKSELKDYQVYLPQKEWIYWINDDDSLEEVTIE